MDKDVVRILEGILPYVTSAKDTAVTWTNWQTGAENRPTDPADITCLTKLAISAGSVGLFSAPVCQLVQVTAVSFADVT